MVLTKHLSHLLGKKGNPTTYPLRPAPILQVEVATHAFKGDLLRKTLFSEKGLFCLARWLANNDVIFISIQPNAAALQDQKQDH